MLPYSCVAILSSSSCQPFIHLRCKTSIKPSSLKGIVLIVELRQKTKTSFCRTFCPMARMFRFDYEVNCFRIYIVSLWKKQRSANNSSLAIFFLISEMLSINLFSISISALLESSESRCMLFIIHSFLWTVGQPPKDGLLTEIVASLWRTC